MLLFVSQVLVQSSSPGGQFLTVLDLAVSVEKVTAADWLTEIIKSRGPPQLWPLKA